MCIVVAMQWLCLCSDWNFDCNKSKFLLIWIPNGLFSFFDGVIFDSTEDSYHILVAGLEWYAFHWHVDGGAEGGIWIFNTGPLTRLSNEEGRESSGGETEVRGESRGGSYWGGIIFSKNNPTKWLTLTRHSLNKRIIISKLKLFKENSCQFKNDMQFNVIIKCTLQKIRFEGTKCRLHFFHFSSKRHI